MKEIYTSPDNPTIWLLKNHLETLGIACHVTNQNMGTVYGVVGPDETWLRLVVEDSTYDSAKQKAREFLTFEEDGLPPWKCPKCAEEIEGQFTECWKCGASKTQK
jgi:hypothetical protein